MKHSILKFHKLDKKAQHPFRQRDGDAAYDMYALHASYLQVGETAIIRTGIVVEIPDHHVGMLFVRSGMGVKFNMTLANGTGIIDPNYRGEIMVALVNNGKKPYTVKEGDRIAQLAVLPTFTGSIFSYPDDSKLSTDTKRGLNKFGSSGR